MSTTNDIQGAQDTIAAIATAPGEAGIAILRVSGPGAFHIADRVFAGTRKPSEAPANTVLYGQLVAAETGAPIDEVILLTFRAPRSYTREDVIEIQGHGGRVTVRRMLRAVLACGARLAEPGEFTRRAFLNGRIDLVQCEAVADLIRAQSDRAAAAALEQLNGVTSHSIECIYNDLIDLDADIEATMDFVEDELPPGINAALHERLNACRASVKTLLDTWEEGHLLREGATVVISGEPNVGKSTLMNRLLGRARSIVTDIPGTTRDTIEEQLVIGGAPIRLVDTAGLREADCAVEREGIRRAESAMQAADVNLYVLDGSRPLAQAEAGRLAALRGARSLVVINKADLGVKLVPGDIPAGLPQVTISLLDEGAAAVVRGVIGEVLHLHPDAPPHAAISERHRMALAEVLTELDQADAMMGRADIDGNLLVAEHLRVALALLGEITGREYSEELLDSIFSRFCIGK